MVSDGGPTDSDRVRHGFRLVAARSPKPAEQDRLLTWLHREQAWFAAHPQDAAAVSGDAEKPELAAWTMLGNVLLNLDETLTKE
jgi:hypothetical protein